MKGWLYDWEMKASELLSLRRLRRRIIPHAAGRTLEIALGTGANIPYYRNQTALTGLEPDPQMSLRAQGRLLEMGREAKLVKGIAEHMPFENQAFDTVVATFAFCTISNPQAAAFEICRVLKQGGLLILAEHGPKGQVSSAIFSLLAPMWKKIAGGCHLDRRLSEWFNFSAYAELMHGTFWFGFGEYWILRKREG
ncbi:class I SAM-dependent methyltransferase [Bdellovibrionota bacterium FG-2]